MQNRGVYMFRLEENRVVDATLSGGLARYMNHSCNPNCVAEVVQIDRENKILIIANRRISRGEEVGPASNQGATLAQNVACARQKIDQVV